MKLSIIFLLLSVVCVMEVHGQFGNMMAKIGEAIAGIGKKVEDGTNGVVNKAAAIGGAVVEGIGNMGDGGGKKQERGGKGSRNKEGGKDRGKDKNGDDNDDDDDDNSNDNENEKKGKDKNKGKGKGKGKSLY